MSASNCSSSATGSTPLSRHPTQEFKTIPRYVQYTSPVSMAPPVMNGSAPTQTLPLNLIALIVSYLDDIRDIARVTRTSRLLYYMTLPQLYERVSLHSYPEIRYVGGLPEGYGGGSPFAMALNGLVTKSHAGLVKSIRIWGNWQELAVEDFEKGRVPDYYSMLGTLVRVAVDRMIKLHTFVWELDCKPLKTLYQGLAARDTLTSLTLKFSASRQPRPVFMIPPMANLRFFFATDIDPLCYPDDFSVLLLQSRKLEDLRLHFSPRMRAQAECSLTLETYFGRCWRENYRLPLKHFGMQNWYGPNATDLGTVLSFDTLSSCSFIDVFGGATGAAKTAFIDETWNKIEHDVGGTFEFCRTNEMAATHIHMLGRSSGLQQMFWISAQAPKTGYTPEGIESAPSPDTPKNHRQIYGSLGKQYLKVLGASHGATLRHLLLSDQWAITADEVAGLVRSCPNLEQLGLALDSSNHATMRLLMPFLPKLYAVRILHNEHLAEHMRNLSHEVRMEAMGRDAYRAGSIAVRWIGFGNFVYRIGEVRKRLLPDGQTELYKNITMGSLEDVQHIEIWRFDCLDISVDPVRPFNSTTPR